MSCYSFNDITPFSSPAPGQASSEDLLPDRSVRFVDGRVRVGRCRRVGAEELE